MAAFYRHFHLEGIQDLQSEFKFHHQKLPLALRITESPQVKLTVSFLSSQGYLHEIGFTGIKDLYILYNIDAWKVFNKHKSKCVDDHERTTQVHAPHQWALHELTSIVKRIWPTQAANFQRMTMTQTPSLLRSAQTPSSDQLYKWSSFNTMPAWCW